MIEAVTLAPHMFKINADGKYQGMTRVTYGNESVHFPTRKLDNITASSA